MKLNSDTLLSFGVFGLGLVAIGYAVGIHSRMKASYDSIADGVTSEIAKNVAKIDEARLKKRGRHQSKGADCREIRR